MARKPTIGKRLRQALEAPQTDGKTVKFKIKTRMPDETVDRTDPYGEMGLSSIKWYYGFIAKRPERIAVLKTVAPM